jgi:hypothetical protein
MMRAGVRPDMLHMTGRHMCYERSYLLLLGRRSI